MPLDIADLMTRDLSDSVEISRSYKGSKLCSYDRKRVLGNSQAIKFILKIPQLSASLYFSILYWMSFDRGLHHFPVLSYLNFKKNSNLLIYNLNSELETLIFFRNVARSLLDTAMQLQMFHRFSIFQKKAFLSTDGSKNHGFLENLLPSVLDQSVR